MLENFSCRGPGNISGYAGQEAKSSCSCVTMICSVPEAVRSREAMRSRESGRMVSVTATQVCPWSVKAAKDDPQINGCGCVPIKLCLWTLKFEFVLIVMCHELLFIFVFSHLKMSKPFLAYELYVVCQSLSKSWSFSYSAVPDWVPMMGCEHRCSCWRWISEDTEKLTFYLGRW